jgi:hypothetical protein
MACNTCPWLACVACSFVFGSWFSACLLWQCFPINIVSRCTDIIDRDPAGRTTANPGQTCTEPTRILALGEMPPGKLFLNVPVDQVSYRVTHGVKRRCNAFARVSINACRLVLCISARPGFVMPCQHLSRELGRSCNGGLWINFRQENRCPFLCPGTRQKDTYVLQFSRFPRSPA